MSADSDKPAGGENYVCQKYDIRMNAGRLRCRDPEIYCKFRSACAVFFMTHRRRGLDDDLAESGDAVAQSELSSGESRNGTGGTH